MRPARVLAAALARPVKTSRTDQSRHMATKLEKVVYTASVHAVGGREGTAVSEDGQLNIKLTAPGLRKPGVNPEQLFAAGFGRFARMKSNVTCPHRIRRVLYRCDQGGRGQAEYSSTRRALGGRESEPRPYSECIRPRC
jgi:hypothetical protein